MKRVLEVELSEPADGSEAVIFASAQFGQSTGAISDLEIASVNAQAESLLGQSAAVLNGQSLSHYLPELLSSGLLDALSGVAHEREVRIAGGVLEGRWLRLRISQHSGGVRIAMHELSAPMAGSIQLITDSRFREAFDNAATGIALVTLDGRWLEVNRAVTAMLGYSQEQLRGMTFQQITHSDDLVGDLVLTEQLLTGQIQHFNFEKRYIHRDGSEVWTELHVSLLYHPDGRPSNFIAHIHDIGARKRIENELCNSQQRLELALECAEMGWWERDVIREQHRWSDSFARLVGYEPDTYPGTVEGFLTRVHPDDRALIAEMNANTDHWQSNLEFRVVLPDGRERWLSSRSKKIFAEDGTLQRIIGVNADITHRKRADTDLLRRATHDPLTNLPNRRTFVERLEQSLQLARRSGVPLAVVFLDLDRFKIVNDTLGHSSGDALLVAVAERLGLHLRADDTVARLGGDEFTMILPIVRDMENGVIVAEKLLNVFEQPFILEGQEFVVGASMGISLYPSDGEDSVTLLRHADDAMRRAKKSGRNQYQFYRAEMTEAAQVQLELERDLRRAIEDQQLELHYQPQFELRSNALIGVEALLRWKHPTRGYIPPLQFIPVAEDSGLIVSIGDWVLRQACKQLAAWQRDSTHRFRVAINVSALQFERHDLVERVSHALREFQIADACWLELELTESLVMRDVAGSGKQLQKLRDLGVQVAIDDFGTGYSSLAYLQRLPIDRLKIDRAFIKDLGGDPDTTPLAQAIIGLAHTLGMEVVAEGIETTQQLEILRGMGCEIGQGYLLGRPAPSSELLERLLERTLR